MTNTLTKLGALVGLLLMLVGLAALRPAHARPAHGLVKIQVIDDRGRPFREYPLATRGGSARAYLEAVQGEEYAIRVRNTSGERVGLVIAVDGRNIISGGRSELGPRERMYVLGPHQSATYRGWRTSKNRVNSFYFTDAGDSYAAAWDDYSAMGVIAVAVYREARPKPDPHTHRRLTPQGAAPEAEPGTGFGDEHWSPSRRVRFTPEHHATARHLLKYEWRETLCRLHVAPCDRPRNRLWPYPGHDEGGYAPYPPRRAWR